MNTDKIQITDEQRTAYLTVLEQIVTEETYTGYGLHKVLNRVLAANGREPVRPQMMYNYLRNGLVVKGVKIFGESLREITKQEVIEFMIRYCTRNKIEIKATETVSEDQLALFDLDK